VTNLDILSSFSGLQGDVDGRAAEVDQPVEAIVSATDRLLGARRSNSQTEARKRAAAEPEETLDSGKGDPEQSAEVVKCCGGRSLGEDAAFL